MKNMVHTTLELPAGRFTLTGDLYKPEGAFGLIIFAHGSGSSRHSPRNKKVAEHLQQHGFATLLFDLLTVEEDLDYSNRFEIDLLAQRLKEVTEWVHNKEDLKALRIGYFGASTGAAAALKAARDLKYIAAVVSRGGRPDLAMKDLPFVKAATLFIVGSRDYDVLLLNEKALHELHCQKKLEVVNGATHLFEEKGALEQVAILATTWFEMHLQPIGLYQ